MPNKTCLVLLVVLCPLYSKGQFHKGDKFIAAELFFTTSSAPGIVTPTGFTAGNYKIAFDIIPKIGYFINEKVLIGGLLGYSHSYEEVIYSSSVSTGTSRAVTAGIFVRRYFPISEKFLFSIEGQAKFLRHETIYTETSTANIQNYRIDVTVRPTFIFLPTPKWSIEWSMADFSYGHSQSLVNESTLNEFTTSLPAYHFGIAYYLRKN